ncbi:hypothetical protein [Streptomyces sp. bgisy027]|uniref:hypothetical protein n=1 Tax=Streptomyces sp. bgisy027 TaxID=3413770 RepID=UPI003D706427
MTTADTTQEKPTAPTISEPAAAVANVLCPDTRGRAVNDFDVYAEEEIEPELLGEEDARGLTQDGKPHIATQHEREAAVTTWLLCSAQPEGRDRVRQQWREGGIALLKCGAVFAAVRMKGRLVRAAAGVDENSELKKIDAFLARALFGGPVFVDTHSGNYYALVPPSTQRRREWAAHRHSPEAECLGRDSYLGVPRAGFTEPNHHWCYWSVPMDGPGDLCTVEAISQLVTVGRRRLAMNQGAACA